MEEFVTAMHFVVRVRGDVDRARLAAREAGLDIEVRPESTTARWLPDQAALFGLLARLRLRGLEVAAVHKRRPPPQAHHSPPTDGHTAVTPSLPWLGEPAGSRAGGDVQTEERSRMTDLEVGPIDYLAVEMSGARVNGEAFKHLVDLVDRGIIRVLDLRAAKVEDDGSVTAVTLADLDGDGVLDLEVFHGSASGLLDDDDLAQSAGLVEPGNAVAIVLYENTWAAPLVTALRANGAEVIAGGRIPATDVIAALDALEAAP
jgi:hypothetical protein